MATKKERDPRYPYSDPGEIPGEFKFNIEQRIRWRDSYWGVGYGKVIDRCNNKAHNYYQILSDNGRITSAMEKQISVVKREPTKKSSL